jgi:hypothetical protein
MGRGITFKEKLKTIQFGVVPGGYRSSQSESYYDAQALPDLPSREEVEDMRSDFFRTPESEAVVTIKDE